MNNKFNTIGNFLKISFVDKNEVNSEWQLLD